MYFTEVDTCGTDTCGTDTYSDYGTETYVDHGTETYVDHGTETYVDYGAENYADASVESYVDPGTETFVDHGTETYVASVESYVDPGIETFVDESGAGCCDPGATVDQTTGWSLPPEPTAWTDAPAAPEGWPTPVDAPDASAVMPAGQPGGPALEPVTLDLHPVATPVAQPQVEQPGLLVGEVFDNGATPDFSTPATPGLLIGEGFNNGATPDYSPLSSGADTGLTTTMYINSTPSAHSQLLATAVENGDLINGLQLLRLGQSQADLGGIWTLPSPVRWY